MPPPPPPLAAADTGFYDARDAEKYEVPESVLTVLRSLCADPSNHVMILSGLGRDKVQQAFGSVPNLSLAVEHGFHYRYDILHLPGPPHASLGGTWPALLTTPPLVARGMPSSPYLPW